MAMITNKRRSKTVGELIETLRHYPPDMSIEIGAYMCESVVACLVQPQPLEEFKDPRGFIWLAVDDDSLLDGDEDW